MFTYVKLRFAMLMYYFFVSVNVYSLCCKGTLLLQLTLKLDSFALEWASKKKERGGGLRTFSVSCGSSNVSGSSFFYIIIIILGLETWLPYCCVIESWLGQAQGNLVFSQCSSPFFLHIHGEQSSHSNPLSTLSYVGYFLMPWYQEMELLN